MRAAVLSAALLAACGGGSSPTATDAPHVFKDAPPDYGHCDSPEGTASVTISGDKVALTRLYVGATWLIGPVAPGTAADDPGMEVHLLFTSADLSNVYDALPCIGGGATCSTHNGVVATIDAAITPTDAVGMHPITLHGVDTPTMTFPGTLTISAFETPFPDGPGRITGSIDATSTSPSFAVTGAFDNSFCAGLLSATI